MAEGDVLSKAPLKGRARDGHACVFGQQHPVLDSGLAGSTAAWELARRPALPTSIISNVSHSRSLQGAMRTDNPPHLPQSKRCQQWAATPAPEGAVGFSSLSLLADRMQGAPPPLEASRAEGAC